MPQPGSRPPRCTYRLQLGPDLCFDDAAALCGYLAGLGASHAYLSPVLQAAPGSAHGYDVVDPTRPSYELGGTEGFARLHAALRSAGLGALLDIVPNHMAVGPENLWWWDVLENGPSSVHAAYFDVDWDPAEGVRNRILLPVLPDRYGRVLQAGGLRLRRREGSLVVCHGESSFPLAPPTLDGLLVGAARLAASAGASAGGCRRLEELAVAFASLPPSWATDTSSVRARHVDKERLRAQLAGLLEGDGRLGRALDDQADQVSSAPERLDALLERQNYRLAFWRAREEELDWRRFFDIDTLIGLRVEDDLVFADSHSLVLSWLAEGRIDGLRVDHVDGLSDPPGYLDRLAREGGDPWVVVEKILSAGERLPPGWMASGTTGYDFAAGCTRVFVDPAGEGPLRELWTEMTGDARSFVEVAHEAKLEVLSSSLAADLARLGVELVAIARSHLRWRDATRAECAEAAGETLACLDVYRTYVTPAPLPLAGVAGEPGSERAPAAPAQDRLRIAGALGRARERREDLDPSLWDLLEAVLEAAPAFGGPAEAAFRRRFQQLSGSVMAKGVEDTAFYRYLPLAALNEVGADPGQWAVSPAELHGAAIARQAGHAGGLLAGSTHDTKRSEDVRARLAVLSELAPEWGSLVRGWRDRHHALWGAVARDPVAESLCYQSLAGTWRLAAGVESNPPAAGSAGHVPALDAAAGHTAALGVRVAAYLRKAARESGQRTSWVDPDEAYESSQAGFVRGVLADSGFVAELDRLVGAVLGEAGQVVSLSMAAIQHTSPGVPDIYQGCEVWDDSLVDPDNRRPVDFSWRRRLLAESAASDARWWWERRATGLPKIGLIHRVLALRARRPEWFGPQGAYRELEISGPASGHLVAFSRGGCVVTVVPRLVVGLARRRLDPAPGDPAPGTPAPGDPASGDPASREPAPVDPAPGTLPMALAASLRGTTVELPAGAFRDVCTGAGSEGGAADAGALLSGFPVAVLGRVGGDGER
ncbi:MAG: malto-oligosyltrehalose synthase [Acidimicrobiales bacterium]